MSRGEEVDRPRGGGGEQDALPGRDGKTLRLAAAAVLRGGGRRHAEQEGEAPPRRKALCPSGRIALSGLSGGFGRVLLGRGGVDEKADPEFDCAAATGGAGGA